MTKQQFLDGGMFTYQDSNYFSYKFSSDTPDGTTGLLIPQKGGRPVPVSAISNHGFVLQVLGRPKPVLFKDCYWVDETNALTQARFQAGEMFQYYGHFQNLHDRFLIYSIKGLMDLKEDDTWEVRTIADTWFSVFKTQFGIIKIDYKECQLIKEKK